MTEEQIRQLFEEFFKYVDNDADNQWWWEAKFEEWLKQRRRGQDK